MNSFGRIKIFTNKKEITDENIVEVLKKAYGIHKLNMEDIQFLIDYERGKQPLQRVKKIRPEIDIKVTSSLPYYIKRFKVGYNHGSPVMMVQRGNLETHNTDSNIDDSGIASLNELWRNTENIGSKDQSMAEFLEIGGIGHKMVDVRSDFPKFGDGPYTGPLTENYYLDSRYAFCVYYNGPGQKKLMGVSFTEEDGKQYFTCSTSTAIYEISDWKILDKKKNILGMANIVEYERAFDRTGCFERVIPSIDALNIKESDLANDAAQRTQQLWWGDNVEFEVDEKTGELVMPKEGDWVLTFSEDGKVAKIQPLSSSFDIVGTQASIESDRTKILQDCYVPIQYSSSGGGSTGVATDMSSGWSATELDALQEQQMTERGKREELELTLRAISFVPSSILPMDAPIRKIHSSDVDFKFLRSKTYDMSVKANTFATYFQNGVHPRHILKLIDSFEDVEQTYLDSQKTLDALQKKMASEGSTSASENNTSGDPINQIEQSPSIDGMNMEKSE